MIVCSLSIIEIQAQLNPYLLEMDFLTGDQCYVDGEDYVYFLGRTKDAINRGVLKFHASEINEALLMHPKILHAAVVSVPNARIGKGHASTLQYGMRRRSGLQR